MKNFIDAASLLNENILADPSRVLGSFTCPHKDGDYTVTVYDLVNWMTGACLIQQVGQGEKHEIVLMKDEANALADILANFARS